MRKPFAIHLLGALAMLATTTPAIVIITYSHSVEAQTQGMERRDERRETRQASRGAKQACKAEGDSRAECRQTKREVKQTGRQDEQPSTPADTTPQPVER